MASQADGAQQGRYQSALEAAVVAAQEAGEMLRAEFHRDGGPRGSGGHAEIDEPVEWVIRKRILEAFPASYLGEETGAVDGQDPEHRWLVDPNDGTSSYLQGWRGSAVSIALLRQGIPVLGVVYSATFPDDQGDLIYWAEGCPAVYRNGRPVNVDLAAASLDDGPIPPLVILSQAGDRNAVANADNVDPAKFIAMPSIAYRLALVAVGEGVAAISLNGPGSWDYGGGHALLLGAGGVLIDQDGKPIQYDSHGLSRCQWCFGGAAAAVDVLHRRRWDDVYRRRPNGAAATEARPFNLVVPQRGAAVAKSAKLARAQGCLLGQLAGDSLGGLVEFSSAARIRARYPDGLRHLQDGGTWDILAGQPTDDSEMALMLGRSILRHGGYDPAEALDGYVHWYRSPPFDIGGTTTQALGAAAAESSKEAQLQAVGSQANTSSQANGSLMRSSPLGVYGAGNPAAAGSHARADSRLTHPNPVCQDACAVFVTAIATAIGTEADAATCYQAALDEAERSAVAPSVTEALRSAAQRPPPDYLTQQGYVLIALQNAFFQLLHAATLEEGVERTVMAGGDTDTNAAIAGALLGSVHGRAAIPAQWMSSLLSCRPLPNSNTSHPRPCEFWPVDALSLAEQLLYLGLQGGEEPAT